MNDQLLGIASPYLTPSMSPRASSYASAGSAAAVADVAAVAGVVALVALLLLLRTAVDANATVFNACCCYKHIVINICM